MTLWLILGVTSLVSIMGMVLVGANPEFMAAASALHKMKIRQTTAGGCLLTLLTFSIPGLWIWYSVQVSDWRFGAIALSPVVFRLLFALVSPKAAAK